MLFFLKRAFSPFVYQYKKTFPIKKKKEVLDGVCKLVYMRESFLFHLLVSFRLS